MVKNKFLEKWGEKYSMVFVLILLAISGVGMLLIVNGCPVTGLSIVLVGFIGLDIFEKVDSIITSARTKKQALAISTIFHFDCAIRVVFSMATAHFIIPMFFPVVTLMHVALTIGLSALIFAVVIALPYVVATKTLVLAKKYPILGKGLQAHLQQTNGEIK